MSLLSGLHRHGKRAWARLAVAGHEAGQGVGAPVAHMRVSDSLFVTVATFAI